MLKKRIKSKALFVMTAVLLYLLFAATIPIVHADTDGTELKTTNQPDKLVLQLGTELADAEFELKLDSGIFPVPVTANSSGVLTMELGGSKTYTLTRRIVDAPMDIPAQPDDPQQPQQEVNNQEREDDPIMMAPSEKTVRIPLGYLFVFLGGLGVITGGLIISKIIKKRREYYYGGGSDEYDDYDE